MSYALTRKYVVNERSLLSAVLVLGLATQPLGAAPLRLITLPKQCDVVVIKSLESNGYLGVSMPYSDQSQLSATYRYGDLQSRFVVNYFGDASGPMALTVKVSSDTSDKRHLLLGFNSTTGVMKAYTYGNRPPSNTLLMLGGWPITSVPNGSLQAGPNFRLYLRNDTYWTDARAVVGVSGVVGQVVLYPMDTAADTANVPFVNPGTLFAMDVVSSPGPTACLRMTA